MIVSLQELPSMDATEYRYQCGHTAVVSDMLARRGGSAPPACPTCYSPATVIQAIGGQAPGARYLQAFSAVNAHVLSASGWLDHQILRVRQRSWQ